MYVHIFIFVTTGFFFNVNVANIIKNEKRNLKRYNVVSSLTCILSNSRWSAKVKRRSTEYMKMKQNMTLISIRPPKIVKESSNLIFAYFYGHLDVI